MNAADPFPYPLAAPEEIDHHDHQVALVRIR